MRLSTSRDHRVCIKGQADDRSARGWIAAERGATLKSSRVGLTT